MRGKNKQERRQARIARKQKEKAVEEEPALEEKPVLGSAWRKPPEEEPPTLPEESGYHS